MRARGSPFYSSGRNYQFCERLAHIRNRHADVVQTMAQGVLELKESHEVDPGVENSIHPSLRRSARRKAGLGERYGQRRTTHWLHRPSV
ncbi:unnamed protein product [Leptidea sinapis]|uniref:Branched-chain alpha-ketoacid dehydrogenase kinase/Pyruvate dehydrogenase kinase N-terminal domain-containing protein n=1 Tax=Leptidea sinapis TaxID=189913 RepID=A0A5E4Q2K6_9NEOP|nr:unnamed protein product [Leptidea sinapis]